MPNAGGDAPSNPNQPLDSGITTSSAGRGRSRRVDDGQADWPDRVPFQLGPDRDDIREARPYFLIPLLDAVGDDAQQQQAKAGVRERIEAAISKQQKVSDVYVLSHGWHRNFFAAVAAYDRLTSRFLVLWSRGRIAPQREFAPLFLTLHWHSDPSADQWEDPEGRRDKTSFLNMAGQLFEPQSGTTSTNFLDIFEDIFQLFSWMSAIDTPALDTAHKAEAVRLFTELDSKFEIRGCQRAGAPALPQLTPELLKVTKAATAWRCYVESDSRAVLMDQDQPAAPYASLGRAVALTLQFAVGAVGLFAVLKLLPPLLKWLLGLLDRWDLPGWEWGNATLKALAATIAANPVGAVTCGLVLCVGIILGCIAWQQCRRSGKGAAGMPWFAVISWLPLQLLSAVPLLATAVPGFFAGWLLARVSFLQRDVFHLFDERIGERDRPLEISHPVRTSSLLYALAGLARLPAWGLLLAVARDSAVYGAAMTLDRQLAFCQMQYKGTEAGRDAALFLSDLVQRNPCLHKARFHFIGHSFGGLVVANAARHLVLDAECTNNRPEITLQSVCIVQGALGSDWFRGEETLAGRVRGRIAAIFSRYDTATGFLYPLGNLARLAAGSVGFYHVGDDPLPVKVEGQAGDFALLVKPPTLIAPARGPVNLDASRIIYAGNPAVGGGHDDIFKDDVVNLIWAALS